MIIKYLLMEIIYFLLRNTIVSLAHLQFSLKIVLLAQTKRIRWAWMKCFKGPSYLQLPNCVLEIIMLQKCLLQFLIHQSVCFRHSFMFRWDNLTLNINSFDNTRHHKHTCRSVHTQRKQCKTVILYTASHLVHPKSFQPSALFHGKPEELN